MAPVRIVLTLSDAGWAAVSPDLHGFAHKAATFMDIVADLPAVLRAHCGHPVEYKVIYVRQAGLD
jgi:hypothetical protein